MTEYHNLMESNYVVQSAHQHAENIDDTTTYEPDLTQNHGQYPMLCIKSHNFRFSNFLNERFNLYD